jgi:DNA-binding NtrC family response regulator
LGILPDTKRLLLLEPERKYREAASASLERAGYQVSAASGLGEAAEDLTRGVFDAVLLALAPESGDPMSAVRSLANQARTTPLLVLCDADRVDLALEALRHGAEDYLLRPPDPVELRTRLRRILERRDLDSRITFFQDEASKRYGLKQLEVRSPGMRSVLDRVLRVAPMRSTVLVSGESGVGKELVARAIHFNSPRRDHPFIALNCAAIPASLIESELFGHEKGAFTGAHTRMRGKFEIAHRGTLFLDEIGEMDLASQAKLLRVLEEREFMRVGGDRSIQVDVRVITATNADLETLVADAGFRQDLYYRLKVVTIRVPPLRERWLDLPALVETFLAELARANAVRPRRISPDALVALTEYEWPGNVRELKNLLESLLVSVTGDVVDVEDLPAYVRRDRAGEEPATLRPGTTLEAMERELIRRTLEHTGGNRTHSAELLGIGVRTLQRKIQSYELSIPPRRRRPRTDRG